MQSKKASSGLEAFIDEGLMRTCKKHNYTPSAFIASDLAQRGPPIKASKYTIVLTDMDWARSYFAGVTY